VLSNTVLDARICIADTNMTFARGFLGIESVTLRVSEDEKTQSNDLSFTTVRRTKKSMYHWMLRSVIERMKLLLPYELNIVFYPTTRDPLMNRAL